MCFFCCLLLVLLLLLPCCRAWCCCCRFLDGICVGNAVACLSLLAAAVGLGCWLLVRFVGWLFFSCGVVAVVMPLWRWSCFLLAIFLVGGCVWSWSWFLFWLLPVAFLLVVCVTCYRLIRAGWLTKMCAPKGCFWLKCKIAKPWSARPSPIPMPHVAVRRACVSGAADEYGLDTLPNPRRMRLLWAPLSSARAF